MGNDNDTIVERHPLAVSQPEGMYRLEHSGKQMDLIEWALRDGCQTCLRMFQPTEAMLRLCEACQR